MIGVTMTAAMKIMYMHCKSMFFTFFSYSLFINSSCIVCCEKILSKHDLPLLTVKLMREGHSKFLLRRTFYSDVHILVIPATGMLILFSVTGGTSHIYFRYSQRVEEPWLPMYANVCQIFVPMYSHFVFIFYF